MSARELKAKIDVTGEAFLILTNKHNEFLFVGNIYRMLISKGKLIMQWQLPQAEHINNFTNAMIVAQGGDQVLWGDSIDPIRTDEGVKKFRLELPLD